MFAKDRDLLARDPNVFRDMAWAGQRLVRGTATVDGTTLTFSSQDATLIAAGVGAGHVVVAGGVPYEVVSRIGESKVTISRMRASEGDPAIPGTEASDVDAWVVTFAPQIEIVHRQVLRMAGMEPGGAGPAGGRVGEGAITNGAALVEVEALGALHLVYAGGAVASGAGSSARIRAELLRKAFREARERAVAEIDLDGDGKPDATRRLNVVQFVR